MDPNKINFNLKDLMNNPDAMKSLQNLVQQNLVNDLMPKKSLTPEEEKEANRKKLREAIRQKSLRRQPKDIQMKEQMKVIEKSGHNLENMDVKSVVNSMVSDPQQKKVLAREMEKYLEKNGGKSS
jgi:ATP-dependent protease HslVU (ClpYQ) ATPase subunit